jgi:hypothetical protein
VSERSLDASQVRQPRAVPAACGERRRAGQCATPVHFQCILFIAFVEEPRVVTLCLQTALASQMNED